MAIVSSLRPEATAESHTVIFQAEVLENEEVVHTLVETDGGSVTLDSNAASRGRFDLNILGEEVAPVSASSLLAPFGNEVRLARGVRYPDGVEELVYLGVFQIERAPVSDNGETFSTSLTGPDRSGRFIDAAFEEPGQIASGTEADDAILQVLLPVWPDMPYLFTYNVTAPLPKIVWEEGEDRWAFAQGVATAIGGELYFNNAGVLVLVPVPGAFSGFPVAQYAEGAGGVLLGVDREWDRSPAHNRFIVTGENTELAAEGTPPPRAVATDDNPLSPTYYLGKFGRKPFFWNSPYISTNDQAALAAAGLLARAQGAPDLITFNAIVDPQRHPGEVVRVTRNRIGINEDHILDQVTIPFQAAGEMACQTRVTQELS